MKKIVFGIVVALIASVVQAATVTWSLSGVKTPADSGVNGVGYLVMAFDSATDQAALKTSIEAGNWDAVSGAAMSDWGTATTTSAGLAKKAGAGNYSAGDTFSAYLVVFDAGSLGSSVQNYFISDVKSGKIAANGANATLAFGTMANQSGSWTSVGTPEPTSGLLLLIGGAMLALRRKQR